MKNKLNSGHYLIIIFFILILIFIIKLYFENNKIEEKGMPILTRLESVKKLPKRTNFLFSYYIHGKKISTTRCGIKKSILNSKEEKDVIDSLEVGAFYLAKYLPEYPNDIQVNPYKKITDTTAILKAGFSKEDIISK